MLHTCWNVVSHMCAFLHQNVLYTPCCFSKCNKSKVTTISPLENFGKINSWKTYMMWMGKSSKIHTQVVYHSITNNNISSSTQIYIKEKWLLYIKHQSSPTHTNQLTHAHKHTCLKLKAICHTRCSSIWAYK